jgi:hypothetical protein
MKKKDLYDLIPDNIFSEVAANPNQFTDVSELLCKQEEIILKYFEDNGEKFIQEKSEKVSEEFKEAGNKSNQLGNLREALVNYNKW